MDRKGINPKGLLKLSWTCLKSGLLKSFNYHHSRTIFPFFNYIEIVRFFPNKKSGLYNSLRSVIFLKL